LSALGARAWDSFWNEMRNDTNEKNEKMNEKGEGTVLCIFELKGLYQKG
jgi:hypothetical protein